MRNGIPHVCFLTADMEVETCPRLFVASRQGDSTYRLSARAEVDALSSLHTPWQPAAARLEPRPAVAFIAA